MPVGAAAANGPASLDRKSLNPPANEGGPQPPASAAAHGSPYHKQLAALNRCVRDWIVKHVDSNPLCDLTPIFKDYEKHLASIECRHGGGGQTVAEAESSGEPGEAEASSGPGALKSSTFSFPGSAAEGTSEKAAAPGQDGVKDGEQPSTGASFSFGKKVDSSVLGSLSSAPLVGFSFPSGNSSLFGKETAQSKPLATPFPAKPPESSAEGGGSDSKGSGAGQVPQGNSRVPGPHPPRGACSFGLCSDQPLPRMAWAGWFLL